MGRAATHASRPRASAITAAEISRVLGDAALGDLLDYAPDGMFIVDEDGRMVVVNAQMEALFGYPREELIGSDVEMLVPEAARSLHRRHRSGYTRQLRARPMGSGLELLGRRKDGSEFPVEISLSPRASADGVVVVAAVRDISERLRLEEERQALLEEARAQQERDRIAMDLHDGIIQSIFGVGLGLEIAAEEARGTPAEELIESSVERLNQVVRDIRGYIFELRTSSRDGDLADSMRRLAGAFRASSPIALESDIPDAVKGIEGPAAAAAFEVAQEALSNVRLHSHAKRARVALTRSASGFEVRVSDDGVGFDAAAVRAEDQRGLREAEARARAVGGTLAVESVRDGGTAVALFVPSRAPARRR